MCITQLFACAVCATSARTASEYIYKNKRTKFLWGAKFIGIGHRQESAVWVVRGSNSLLSTSKGMDRPAMDILLLFEVKEVTPVRSIQLVVSVCAHNSREKQKFLYFIWKKKVVANNLHKKSLYYTSTTPSRWAHKCRVFNARGILGAKREERERENSLIAVNKILSPPTRMCAQIYIYRVE